MPNLPHHPNLNWSEWSTYIIKTVDEVKGDVKVLDSKVSLLSNEISQLKVKSGVWGVIGGAIPVAIMITVYLLVKA